MKKLDKSKTAEHAVRAQARAVTFNSDRTVKRRLDGYLFQTTVQDFDPATARAIKCTTWN